MAAASEITLRGTISALPEGSRSIAPINLSNANAPIQVTQITLASGDNTITVPSSAIGAVIIFDILSTTVKKLKGAGGDTGVILSKNKWTVLSFDSAPLTDFILNSSATDTSRVTTIHFF